ncbi:DUF3772 domain-containing protein [Obesumbacterium proteus]|uniref:DUF3772 domain-containing protein n=1 Tax=Obesumbacterium proteus TaxID=82983 RepID=UPI001F262687|nr:DUF3772 domain-containing protein [Obesumbacterium proteus]MCE9883098.1 DUF3772 domain-containing protein [Obesumbacterium proteus]MCE9914740.1 DUF3772 domain-containing protein [Obesumbacterium proteus]MCE9929174.1 DUF3772 domain-containing protein [Obesumbacterium proteus]MCG2876196.1 DUF3772 domain-containing protein [Obesumbacterium proteus]
MLKMLKTYALLMMLLATPLMSHAASGSTQQVTASTQVDSGVLQKRLDTIKQQVANAQHEKLLGQLNSETLQLAEEADAKAAELTPEIAQIQAQLDVLGPKADDETPEVTQQRTALNRTKTQLDKQIEQINAVKTNAANLSTQINNLRRSALKSQIALNSGTILGQSFWSPVLNSQNHDLDKFSDFNQQLSDAWDNAWQPGWKAGSVFYLLLALAFGVFSHTVLDKPVSAMMQRWLPEGRLRRSVLAFSTTVLTAVMLGTSAHFLCYLLIRLPDISPMLVEFAQTLVRLTVFSSLIAGLGNALLSNRHPSWRLPNISDTAAKALAPFPTLIATAVFIFSILEQLNNLVGASIAATVFCSGLLSLLVALIAILMAVRVTRLRHGRNTNNEQVSARSALAGFIHLAISATSFAIIISLLTGYILLARFLTYELIWVWLVLACLYLLIHLMTDLCESVFTPSNHSGKILKSTLSLSDRHLSLAATLFAAVGKTVLVLFAVIALLSGTYGSTTPLALLQKVIEIWRGKGLGGFTIIPAHALNAVLCLVIGWYILRTARRWLDNDFLPKTMMDRGMRASLVTLFTNVGYVLIILLTLSTLGIEWNKLAWIVSALSVGIGFGLQEIVKNFISGLILLTERPVKVGDLISISGVEGDIRRINVRATEIQLSDRSTVIVPNSQLISQNVRNATMGNAQGVVTIALTFPLDIDPEQTRALLLDAYHQHVAIQPAPAPSVSFKELGPNGIVLSVTGYVASPRVVSGTKSDLLYEILKRLRAAGINLSQSQTMVIERAPAALTEE